MKLISLYIENFGTLSRYALDFEEGITTLIEPNGFGKTTLAEFIRAMFYGFPRKAKTLEKSKRQKYAPWSGGRYGGNLVFEHAGVRWRIERTFGSVPKEDTFCLIDISTGKKSSRYGEQIGIELFGMDSESFERSVYLPQLREEGTLSTSAIQAKLSDLVEDSGDVAGYDRAMAALRTKRSALIPYRGSGGAVAEETNRISCLQTELDRALLQQQELQQTQVEILRLQEQNENTNRALKQTGGRLHQAVQNAADRLRQQQYADLRALHDKAARQVTFYRKKYPDGFPDETQLQQMEAAADRLAAESAQRITTQADLDAQAFLKENALPHPLPTAAELADCRRLCGEYAAQQAQLADLRLTAAELAGQGGHQTRKKKSRIPPAAAVLWFMAICAMAAGGVLLSLEHSVYGTTCLAAGAAMLAGGLLIFCIRAAKNRAAEQENRLLRQSVDGKLERIEREIASCAVAGEQLRAQISTFLSDNGMAAPRDFFAALAELEYRRNRYTQAEKQVECWNSRVEAHEQILKNCREELDGFFLRYGQIPEEDVRTQLRLLRQDIHDAHAAQLRAEELSQQMQAMENSCGNMLSATLPPAADPQEIAGEEQRLREKLTEETTRLLHLQQKEARLRDLTSKIPQLQEDLELACLRRNKYRKDAQILDDTMEFLSKARENLSTAYLGTIRNRFGTYLRQLEGVSCESFLIDTDLQVQLERQGQARELGYFSAGQTDLVMLCMRLALVDALFKGQQMFVILDDPFVNLDDAHTEKGLQLLRRLAQDRQILYMTCHTGRKA